MVATQILVTSVAALAHLTLAVLTLRPGGRGRLRRSLGGMALSFFVWLAADVGSEYIWTVTLEIIDESAVALTAAFGIDYLLTFSGLHGSRRRLLNANYVYFSSLSLVTLSGTVFPPMAWFAASPAWSSLMLAGLLFFGVWAGTLLVRYARRVVAFDEQIRARTVMLALLLGLLLAPIDAVRTLSPMVESGLPRLSDLGSLLCTMLLYAVASRARVQGRELAADRGFQALVVVAVMLVVSAASFLALRDNVAAWFAVSTTATAIILLVTSTWVQRTTAARSRDQNLATLGRMSAQLAHDLRNPIAAIKSSAQFLIGEEQSARIQLTTDARRIIELVEAQADRANAMIERYRVFGEQPIRRAPTPIDQLLARSTAAAQTIDGVKIETEIAPSLSAFSLDPDLMRSVLENLIRNAVESMPEGGLVRVKAIPREHDGLELSVEDSGVGMNSGDIEQALAEFYTTKSGGSGLGLAFVRRIVENHGGRVEIESSPGVGTRVVLLLPAEDNG
ncbi:MAG: ATP-binding protein [Myxococcota bacterium]